ncbi:hypothetical protein AKO1_007521 [Acrasis kona]|uniref:Uncharacterized protein n=1 Tax=Acrasis kona TaxID=1008807 RepID=A0AAW2YRD5_9EUKA
MLSNGLPNTKAVKRHLVSFIIGGVWIVFAALEFATPFFIFTNKEQNRELTKSENGDMIYLYTCPIFIVPVVGVIAILAGVCSHIISIILHFTAAIFNIGVMTYFIIFFQSRAGMDLTNKLYQLVVPPIIIACVAIGSIVLTLDQCRLAYYNRKKEHEESNTHYIAMKGGKMNDFDSDSD